MRCVGCVGIFFGIFFWPDAFKHSELCAQPPKQVPKVAPDLPKIIINNRGPRGRIYSLAFSNDSEKLFAAGGDRAVHVWDVGFNKEEIERNLPDKAVYLRSLHWEVGRTSFLGKISALSINPKEPLIAVAGISARNSGDIWIFDYEKNDAVGVLPQGSRSGEASEGHKQAVEWLDWSLDGSLLGSSDKIGRVIRWHTHGSRKTDFLPPEKEVHTERLENLPLVLARDGVIVASNSPEPGLTRLTKPEDRQPILNSDASGVVLAIAKNSKSFFAGTGNGKVLAGSLSAPNAVSEVRLKKSNIREIRSIAVTNRSRLICIAGNDKGEPNSRKCFVEIHFIGSDGAAQFVWGKQLSDKSVFNPVAFSWDDRRFAYADKDGEEIVVHRLPINLQPGSEEDAVQRTKLAIAESTLQLSGRGKNWTEAILDQYGTTKIFLKNTDSADDSSDNFDMFDFEIDGSAKATAIKAHFKSDKKPSASKKISKTQFAIQSLTDKLGNKSLQPFVAEKIPRVIPWIHGHQRSVTAIEPIVKSIDGENKTIGVAIASETNEIYVYSYPSLRLLRRFAQHESPVVSLGVSEDSNFMVSVAGDRTARLWDLRGAFDSDERSTRALWGGTFEVDGKSVVAKNVVTGGPLDFLGVSNGTKIDEIRLPNSNVSLQGAIATAALMKNVDDFKVEPNARSLLKSSAFYIQGIGWKSINPAWPALLTIYATKEREWAAWRYDGVYDASPLEGGELFGWQINQAPGKNPILSSADFVRNTFERPEVIADIFETRLPTLQTEKFVVENPQVKIASKRNANGVVSIVATSQSNSAPELFVNGAAQPAPVLVNGFHTWNPLLTEPINRIEAVLLDQRRAADTSTAAYHADKVFVRPNVSGKPSPRPMLHFVSIFSASEYNGQLIFREDIEKLYDHKDDVRLRRKLQEASETGRAFFNLSPNVWSLRDREVSKASFENMVFNIEKSLADTKDRSLHPVLVYLYGHGIAPEMDKKFRYVTTSIIGEKDLDEKALTWDDFYKLKRLRCPVIFILCTCHSGSVLTSKESSAGLKRAGFYFISAASADELAWRSPEDVEIGDLFTYLLTNAFDESNDRWSTKELDVDGNKIVQLHEIVRFLQQAVPQARKEHTDEKQRQNPIFYPTDLGESSLNLIRTN